MNILFSILAAVGILVIISLIIYFIDRKQLTKMERKILQFYYEQELKGLKCNTEIVRKELNIPLGEFYLANDQLIKKGLIEKK